METISLASHKTVVFLMCQQWRFFLPYGGSINMHA